ncbi:MAG: DUF1080 domain-containing protein, partial [Bacteroidetes bacterium]|nr:DUF1080 domain-containing protein [Bacteroidota bacterium]
ENFDAQNNRNWINENFWSVPIENWMIHEGRLECTGVKNNNKTVLLTHLLDQKGEFLINLRMGVLNDGEKTGSGGLIIGMQDDTDMDIKSLTFFGTGLNVGIDTDRQLFLGELSSTIPDKFDLKDFTLHIDGLYKDGHAVVRLQASDENGNSTTILEKDDIESFAGAIALVNHHPSGKKYSGNTRFWFDDLSLSGTAVISHEENAFGPILWSMYTLSKNKLKLSVQMPPLGPKDNQYIELHFLENDVWEINQSVKMNPDSRTAVFAIDNWNSAIDKDYKLIYREKSVSGEETEHLRQGIIRKEPKKKTLVLGGLTCQYHYGFPYRPLVENLQQTNPDMLYFSGDQLYEGNGGYGIVRFPADAAILNYLGKWYMFGWAFGDLMKDRPTITIPDDHDIFQGNLWGDGGREISQETFSKFHGTSGGYIEPAKMVSVVHLTQCSHLPDPYDSTPMDQGIPPYYTELLYGDVSFAIVGDRMFKSGPNTVAYWPGRQDHIKDTIRNLSRINPPGLQLLGDRQMNFLKNWAQNWSGAKMKCLLSQTIFSNIATHHGGNKMVLFADLDSGGWPMTARNEAVEVMRSCFSFHIAGDQHLPSMIQYGTENYRDAGWAFCTPAISVGYQRRFQPEKLAWPISERPEHNLPNTGKYRDPFGHPSYVYAVGNPEDNTSDPNRYVKAQKCSSGFGLIHFNTDNRTIQSEAFRFLANMADRENSDNQFPGWPVTIGQLDNYGKKKLAYLKEIELNPEQQYLQLYSENTGELVYALRPESNTFKAFVFSKGQYTIRVVDEITGEVKEYKGLGIVR